MKEDFIHSLEIMGQGMAGILVAILIITFIVMIMGKISKKKNQE